MTAFEMPPASAPSRAPFAACASCATLAAVVALAAGPMMSQATAQPAPRAAAPAPVAPVARPASVAAPDRAVAELPRVIIDWPTLPAQRPASSPTGPVEPSALRSDVPRIDTGRAPERDDDRRLREREEAVRERTRAALEEQGRRAVAPPAPAPAMPFQNCTPAGCFDAQGRFLPRAGPTLITPSGQPCLPTAAGTGC